MTRINLTRSETVFMPHLSCYQTTLTAASNENITNYIFVKQRLRNINKDGTVDEFRAIATPVQLEDFNQTAPAAGTSYFLDSSVCLVSETAAHLECIVETIMEDVQKLIKDYDASQLLEVTANYKITPDQIISSTVPTDIGLFIPLYGNLAQGAATPAIKTIKSIQAFFDSPIVVAFDFATLGYSTQDASYLAALQLLNSAGVRTIPYFDTASGTANMSIILQNIQSLQGLYQGLVSGVYLGNVAATDESKLSYYSQIRANYNSQWSDFFIVGDTGNTVPIPAYSEYFDMFVTQNTNTLTVPAPLGFASQAIVGFDIAQPSDDFIRSLSPSVRMVYATDQSDFTALSSYITNLAYKLFEINR